MTRQVTCLDLCIWNKRRNKTQDVEVLRLISREEDGSAVKYSVTNDINKDGYITLTIMALHYMLEQKIMHEQQISLYHAQT